MRRALHLPKQESKDIITWVLMKLVKLVKTGQEDGFATIQDLSPHHEIGFFSAGLQRRPMMHRTA